MKLRVIRVAVVIIFARVPTYRVWQSSLGNKGVPSRFVEVCEKYIKRSTHITAVMMNSPVLQIRNTVNMAKLMYLVSW